MPHFFDVLGIREEAKKQIQFIGQQYDVTGSGNIEEIYLIPQKYAQAYLFKLIKKESEKQGGIKAKPLTPMMT